MATTRKIPNLPGQFDTGCVDAINAMIDTLVAAGKVVHHEYKSADLITTADASSLATSKTLTAALAVWIPAHGADTDIHTAADTIAEAAAWASSPAEPADLTEVQNVLNELKSDINAHVAVTAAHRGSAWGDIVTNGVTAAHTIGTADATDQASANALANAIKAFCNLHMQAAASTIEVVDS